MKSRSIVSTFFIVAIAFLFFSCSSPFADKEPTYTVWTDTCTSAEFTEVFGHTISDGMYTRIELTNDQFNSLNFNSSASEYRHDWTITQIKTWLVGRGFGENESTRESSWITTVNHCLLASRTGNIVYLIVK